MSPKNVRLKFSSIQDFTTFLFTEERVRGCWFKKNKGRFYLKAFASVQLDPEAPAEGWNTLRKKLGYGKNSILFLSGSAGKDAVFFRTAVPQLSTSATRDALLFELPRIVLRDTAGDIIQFTPACSDEENPETLVNVYSFPAEGMDSLTAILSQSLKKADYYLYPLLPLRMTDGPIYLPEVEKDFFFANGQWHDKAQWNDSFYKFWETNFHERFDLPDTPDFSIRDYLGCLLVARFASAADFAKRSPGIDLLPKEYRPGRLRNQLRIMTVLLVLLFGGLIWKYGGQFYRDSRELSRLEAQARQLDTQLRKAKQRIKSAEKSQKELQRVLNQKAGENHVIEKLAAFSKLLPANVMVQNLRWTDSSIDLTLRSEAENLNIPAIINPAKYWKISQMQERRRNNEAVSTITLKLVPASEGK